jgi:hypothetical protein
LGELEERGFSWNLEYRPSSGRNFDWLPFTPPLVAFSGPSVVQPLRDAQSFHVEKKLDVLVEHFPKSAVLLFARGNIKFCLEVLLLGVYLFVRCRQPFLLNFIFEKINRRPYLLFFIK